MNALPIGPTAEQLTEVVLDASRRGEPPTVALFRAGVEAERARAAAEMAEEWGTKSFFTDTVYDHSSEGLARGAAERTGRRLMRRTADAWQEVPQ